MSIFAAPTSANGSLELKCGYCTFADKLTAEQKSLTITPQSDKKGFLSIAPPGQDGVVHLKWTNREVSVTCTFTNNYLKTIFCLISNPLLFFFFKPLSKHNNSTDQSSRTRRINISQRMDF